MRKGKKKKIKSGRWGKGTCERPKRAIKSRALAPLRCVQWYLSFKKNHDRDSERGKLTDLEGKVNPQKGIVREKKNRGVGGHWTWGKNSVRPEERETWGDGNYKRGIRTKDLGKDLDSAVFAEKSAKA